MRRRGWPSGRPRRPLFQVLGVLPGTIEVASFDRSPVWTPPLNEIQVSTKSGLTRGRLFSWLFVFSWSLRQQRKRYTGPTELRSEPRKTRNDTKARRRFLLVARPRRYTGDTADCDVCTLSFGRADGRAARFAHATDEPQHDEVVPCVTLRTLRFIALQFGAPGIA
jgi:hypothetical protein